jgi:hypothetical protein
MVGYWNIGRMGKTDLHCKLQNRHGKMQNENVKISLVLGIGYFAICIVFNECPCIRRDGSIPRRVGKRYVLLDAAAFCPVSRPKFSLTPNILLRDGIRGSTVEKSLEYKV